MKEFIIIIRSTVNRIGDVIMRVGKHVFPVKGHYKTSEKVEGKYKPTKTHNTWRNMILRCYDEKHPSYSNYGGVGVSVCRIWHDFQKFATWFENHKHFGKGYHLDKDLKVKGNKVYCEDTCCLIPNEINNLLQMNLKRDNKTGYKGVTLSPEGKYVARCKVGKGCYHFIGSFANKEDAFYAYKVFKSKRIKLLADEYLLRGIICEDVHCNLLSFEVED